MASSSGPSTSSSSHARRASARAHSTLVASEVPADEHVNLSDNDVVDTSDDDSFHGSDNDIVVPSDNELLDPTHEPEPAPPRKRPRTNLDTVSLLRRELREQREDNINLQERLKRARRLRIKAEQLFEETKRERMKAEEILQEARRERRLVDVDAQSIPIDALLGIVKCEICEDPAWRPYLLPACGHVFCEVCLEKWFNTIVDNYRIAHPNWAADAPAPKNLGLIVADQTNPDPHGILALLVQMGSVTDVGALDRAFPGHGQLWQLIKQGVRFGSAAPSAPKFSCPSCRRDAKTRPVMCYRLKELTTMIADFTGEVEPDALQGKGKQKASSVWDKFFGKDN